MYKYKDVDYDERAQEILQGGNTFVNVYYECGIFDDVAADWLPMARGAYESVEDGAKLFGDLYLSRSGFRTWVSEVNSIIKRDCNSAEHLAEFMYKYAQFGTIAV